MKLLAISSPEFIPGETVIINGLFRDGLECMHIRKPESKTEDFASLLSEIEPVFLDRIAIHQHHELAAKFGIWRLHFTENNRRTTSDEQLKKLCENGFMLSTSIHNLTDLKNISTAFSYTFFGPVFDSISKSGYKSAVPVDFFMQEKSKRIPVIGLGGIDISNIQKVRNMNLDGAAVLGVLWREPARALEVFRMLREYQDPCSERATPLTPGLLPWDQL
ncbi:thiamine phosphate synthase [Dyadobacter sp. CY312]|uniref:thiamine phosphate synthase n=1 Tax=Dyadobacter sp. CY312 TaxID=2907303 RepID=UPI001F3E83C7|nr:thiamine phosphate synthase [Dyadobacter sp. CY312]MCE7039648.1 thiamine phosphate synthase [Dyadobacter sp. CY312]